MSDVGTNNQDDDGYETPPPHENNSNEEIRIINNLRAERTHAIMVARRRIRRRARRARRFVDHVPQRVLRLRALFFGPPSPPGSPRSCMDIISSGPTFRI